VIDLEREAEDVDSASAAVALPAELPVLPLRDAVTYPDTITPLAVGQERSIQLINDVLAGNRLLVMVSSRDPEVETPGPDELYDIGVVGTVARMLKVPDGSLRILVHGSQRVRIDEWTQTQPYLAARVSELPEVARAGRELTALARNAQQTFTQIIDAVPYLPEELGMAVANLDDPSALSHLIAGALRLSTDERQSLLEEVDVERRLRRLTEMLAREADIVAIGSRIQDQVQSEMDRGQREWFLRQQLKAIQDELGEQDPAEAEVRELREQLDAANLPEPVRRQADRELSRLEKLPQAAAEHGVIRGYLEWIAELPWSKYTEDDLDLTHAREVLDADHYDIESVKDRILEFLAVRKLKPDARGSILCFAGPPGVGKTSLGQSIARALGRKFERISLGGVRDESEIRGHRRTYIGAMPGTIVRALRDAGSANPLFMIDEIDKLGADYRGDPASAMLEVLDPEQNSTFRDHYLDVRFDLSRVMFICTANDLDRIPGPLHDRMEIIRLAGYTEEEKLEIARRYLVPRQIERTGLKRSQIGFSDAGLKAIIADYTREAGVRALEREIGSVCRKVALQVAEGRLERKVSVTGPKVRQLLGRPRFHPEARRRTAEPGVATGLAWTPAGGDVLFVEATAMPGKGQLTITGQLGEVMRESAQAATAYLRAHARVLAPGLPEGWFSDHDVHIHVPAGAIPKDGPSAGVTMATALLSLVTDRPVRGDVAMTGELTLTGQVLPIGGLKEKALAAQRAGIGTVIAPRRNEADLEDLPPHLLADLDFRWVDEVGDVFDSALRQTARPRRG
jgi:ATP-dependent Lon protease